MKTLLPLWLLILTLPVQAADPLPPDTYPDPARFEAEVKKFETADLKNPPPEGAVVALGSSSIRLWHEHIAADLAPIEIVPRGFGGSNMHDAFHYLTPLALKHSPRAVILYEGDNDLAQGISPERILEEFQKIVAKLHTDSPHARLYFLSIKPSPSRAKLWPLAQRTNQLIAEECSRDGLLYYVDLATPMLDQSGKPRPELFIKDNLHLNRAGYELWRDTLKPLLLKVEPLPP